LGSTLFLLEWRETQQQPVIAGATRNPLFIKRAKNLSPLQCAVCAAHGDEQSNKKTILHKKNVDYKKYCLYLQRGLTKKI
jgi:transaldolase